MTGVDIYRMNKRVVYIFVHTLYQNLSDRSSTN